MALKAVLLDVDGTLVDSNDLHVLAWRAAFRRHGKNPSLAEVHAQLGKGGELLVRALLDEGELARIGKAIASAHVEIFLREYRPREQRLPCVRELLERMKAQGLRLVLASSATDQELEGHLKVLAIDDLIEARTTALERLEGLKPDEALVIGDSPYDAEAARKAGMPMIGVLTGGFTEQKLRASGASRVYRDLCDLLRRYDESPLFIK